MPKYQRPGFQSIITLSNQRPFTFPQAIKKPRH
jgi:hypothetical protein